MSQDTARKRTNRALEKLRHFFAKRGVVSTTAIIALAISANSVQAAPSVLVKSVASVAIAKGTTASSSTLALIKGALKLMAWANAKAALTAGVVLLAAAGGTTLVVTNSLGSNSAEAQYEAIFSHPDASSIPRLESAPPTLIVRPNRNPNHSGGIWTTTGKGVYVNEDVEGLTGVAYGFGPTRMVEPADMPPGSYDYLATLPSRQNEALQDELKKQFGIVAHRETRETDVLLLKVKDPTTLNAHRSKGGQQTAYIQPDDQNNQVFFFKNVPCSRLTSLEGYAQKPILDRTGLNGRYDLKFSWPPASDSSRSNRLDRIWRELLPQLERSGLEFVPAREPVELLIVERVKD
jgi:uncharacterized protein (TIGR03435 family)